MRKNVYGRQLKRDKNERTALFKGLISSLVLHERIKTTEDKAKAIRGQVDKIMCQIQYADKNPDRGNLGFHFVIFDTKFHLHFYTDKIHGLCPMVYSCFFHLEDGAL